MDDYQIGRAIRLSRQMKGLKLMDVSVKTGISRSHLSSIENGTRDPSWKTLVKIANGLDTTVMVLVALSRLIDGKNNELLIAGLVGKE